MIRALIFDFDGLILDTESPDYQAWREVFESCGAVLPLSEWAVCIGTRADAFDPYAYLEPQLGRTVDRQTPAARHRRRRLQLVRGRPVQPGVKDTIAAAKGLGLKIGLASSSSGAWVKGHLARLGLLENFDAIRCADHVRNVKPDPELYLSALDALDVAADQAFALEDSPNGVLAARRAGLFCVAVPNPVTRHLDLTRADLQLASLADLPLDRLLADVVRRQGRAQGHHPDRPRASQHS